MKKLFVLVILAIAGWFGYQMVDPKPQLVLPGFEHRSLITGEISRETSMGHDFISEYAMMLRNSAALLIRQLRNAADQLVSALPRDFSVREKDELVTLKADIQARVQSLGNP